MRFNTKLRPAGHTFYTDLEGSLVECDTLRCCHCGMHWEVIPGSGRLRGFCTRCNSVTCGKPECDVCVPLEQILENIESGKPLYYRPGRG